MEETKQLKEDKKTKSVDPVDKALADMKAKFDKDYGKGSIINANEKRDDIPVVSTGSILLDKATGIGGFPLVGCVVELLGWESAGKSTATLIVIGNVQKATGKRAALFDGEHSFSKKYAKKLGVNIDTLDIVQPSCGEDAYDMAKQMGDSGLYSIIVFDSQTSIKPKKVVEGTMETSHLGLEARMMGDAVNKMLGVAARNNIPIVFISQLREKIGAWGDPTTTSGGHALKYYAHMRIMFQKSTEKTDGEAIGNKNKVQVIKNKFAAPFGKAEYSIKFGEGPDNEQEILDLALEQGLVIKSSSWFSCGEYKVQGEDKFKQLFLDNPEFYEEIKKKVLDESDL
jgi:recombination protein RecA